MSGPITPAPIASPPGATATALDLIKSAMRLIHVLAPGEEPPGAEANDALKILNQMLDGWMAEQLMVYTTQIQDFPFVTGKQVHTLGPGGDFDVPRPARITGVSVIILTNPTVPVEYPIPYVTDDQWQERYPVKGVQSSFPLLVYDDGAFPLRNLAFWPIPIDPNQFRMYSWGPLYQFNDMRASYAWPPGYMEALRYNLALVLADEWSGELGPTVIAAAIATKARIKTMNVTIETLKCDQAVVRDKGSANYRADMFNLPY